MPALKFIGQNAALFEAGAAPRNADRLRQLLADDNPFIAIAAGRALIEANLLQGEAAQKALTQANGYRLSVLVYLMLKQPEPAKQLPPDDRSQTSEQLKAAVDRVNANDPLLLLLGQSIDRAQDAQTLQALSQGLLAATSASSNQNLFATRRSDVLLQRIAEKQTALKTRTDADVYLGDLFVLLNVRARPNK